MPRTSGVKSLPLLPLPVMGVLAIALVRLPNAVSMLGAPDLVGQRNSAMAFTISSPSFSNGGNIDKKFTCDAADVSPQLTWTQPPAGTKSFALLVDDPDAPAGNWNHWTMWNIPANVTALPESVPKTARLDDGSEQGANDFHKTGYNGPCPPPGKPHRYYFRLYALDAMLNLKAGATTSDLEGSMKGHVLAQAEWMGRYRR
jgi:Raf kinase inhibitor-like YbhB/YbcL family protein